MVMGTTWELIQCDCRNSHFKKSSCRLVPKSEVAMKRSSWLPLLLLGSFSLTGACTATPADAPMDLAVSAPDQARTSDLASASDLATPDLQTADLADAVPCPFGQVRRAGRCVCAFNDDQTCAGGYCCAAEQQCLMSTPQDAVRCSAAPKRLRPAFAYDVNRKTSLVFGGVAEIGQPPLATAYELTPATWSVVRGTAAQSPPAARYGSTLVYDDFNKRLLLFGGQVNDNLYFNDLWAYDGAAWARVTTGGQTPLPRALTAMVYDSARRVVVLFGGDTKPAANMGSQVAQDTWELNVTASPNTWVLRNAGDVGTNPAPREGHAMAYDSMGKRVVLFGGTLAAQGPFVYSSETWAWNGNSWQLLVVTGAPNPRSYYGMAYDSARNVVVMSGGETNAGLFQALGDVFELSGTTWTKRSSPIVVPGRSNHSMTYDANRKMTLTFGGLQNNLMDASNQLWGWDGSNWQQLY